MSEMLHHVFVLDSRTLLVVLFLGNLAAASLVLTYRHLYLRTAQSELTSTYIPAKLLQALAFLLYLLRGYVNDFTSVIIGNILLLSGSYFESVSIQRVANIANKRNILMLRIALGVWITVFIIIEYLFHSPANRIVYSSIGVFLLIFISNIQLITNKRLNTFKRTMSFYYLIFLLFLLPRIIYTITTPEGDIFTNTFLHSMTFVSMIILLLYGQSFYLLLTKEKADELLSRRATIDELSGLLNRRSFLEKAGKEFEAAKEQYTEIALFFCDIDFFKGVNDVYGHPFGDKVIRKCAQVLKSCVRKGDMVCRYGGEEFIIFVSMSNSDIVRILAERILFMIRSTRFENKLEFSFTISIGVVCGIPQAEEVLGEYIKRADQALYMAKNSGRNRYCIYSGIPDISKTTSKKGGLLY